MDEQSIRSIIDQYNTAPQLFDNREDDLESLEEHASYYRIPFAKQQQHQDALIISMLKEAGKGFAEGFTTLPLAGKASPKNTWEGIANNLGHLAGFVGYLPGGRAFKRLGILKRYTEVADNLRGVSVPMGIANVVQGKARKAIEPILKDLPDFAKSPIFSDMASGAFHLGTASAVSSWTHGVDEMMNAAGFGGIAGGAFRFIGNMKGFGKRIEPKQMKPNGSPDFSKLEDGQKFDLFMRTTAGAMFQGLPSSVQGATTEEQVYAYAMGAFFGFKEVPYQTRTSREFLADTMKKDTGPDPELNPKWDTLTTEMKDIVKRDFRQTFRYNEDGPSETSHMLYDFFKGKLNLENIDEMGRGFRENYVVDEVTGEVRARFDKREMEDYQKEYKKDKSSQDSQDMDMHFSDVADVPGTLIGKGGYVDNLFKDIGSYERIGISTEINKAWEGLHINGKPAPGAEQKIIEFIESSSWGRALNEKEKSWWRRWAETTRKKEFVEQINIVDTEISIQKGITNALGNRKELKQEPLIIEELWKQEVWRTTREKIKENNSKNEFPDNKFLRVLDEIIYNGKAYDLSRAEEGIAREHTRVLAKEDKKQYWEYQKEGKAYAKGYIKNRMSELVNKMYEAGYYYFGGKGDAKKMYFVKLHPSIAKTTNTKDGSRKGMATRYLKKINKVIDNFLKNSDPAKYPNRKKAQYVYNESLKKFKETYPKAKNPEKQFRQMFVSNVLYDIQNNGLSVRNKDFIKNFEKVLGDGFINDPRGFNKRQQIWFNTGYSADPVNVARLLKTKGLTLEKDADGNDSFRVIVFNDASNKKIATKEGAMPLFAKASEYTEATDGAIIGRNSVVDALNFDKGMPTEGKMNKSFIVEPYVNNPEYGALLGKYAIHIPSPELAQFMKKNKIQMVMPLSAVKQTGGREVGNLKFGKGNKIEFEGKSFLLPVKAFRTVMTEITAKKFLNPQRMPKQMSSVLSEYGYSNIDRKAMKDMQDTLTLKATQGTPEGQEALDSYYRNKSPENMTNVLNNLENLPLEKVFEIVKSKDDPRLAQKVYEEILRVDAEQMKMLAEEGEMNREQYEQVIKNTIDYESILERISSVYPDGTVAAYLHKFSRDYRMQAMRNYVVHKFTRPQLDNSASARMRPYELGFQKKNKNRDDTTILNTDDGQKVFFLDEGFRDLKIYDPIFGKRGMITLGELWTKRNEYLGKDATPAIRSQVKEILNAMVMRVPMDSISGAHKLEFKGFTGVEGYGSLLHPRTMRALGGADLDGDKATIFFGGEARGFRKSWKEMYHKNKDEYVNWDGTKGSPKPNVVRIISGFQTGADIAGNQVAKELGLETGGTAPKGFRTDDGLKPEYRNMYGGIEISNRQTKNYDGRESTYGPRTEQNVLNSDGTVIFGNLNSPGSKLTHFLANKHGKFVLLNPTARELNAWLNTNGIKTLNVAGNRERSKPGINKKVKEILREGLGEFKGKEGGVPVEQHNKNEIDPYTGNSYASAIAERDPKFIENMEHLMNQYSPYWRQYISQQTFSGRDNLGVAVVQRASVLGAYNMVRNAQSGPDAPKISKEVYEPYFDSKGNKKHYVSEDTVGEGAYGTPLAYKDPVTGQYSQKRVVFTTKNGEQDLKRFREMARAMIAIGSDPMDEAKVNGGLIPKKIFDTLFDVKIYNTKGKNGAISSLNKKLTQKYMQDTNTFEGHVKWVNRVMQKGPQSMFNNVNRVLYSRNYSENRRYSFSEIQQGVRSMDWLPENVRTTFLPRIAKEIQGVDWSDGLFTRMDFKALRKVYDSNQKSIVELDALKEVMGRDTLNTPMSKLIKMVFDERLYDATTRRNLSKNTEGAIRDFENLVNQRYTRKKDGESVKVVGLSVPDNKKVSDPRYKEAYLENLVLKAEDFMINDLSDMASLKVVADVIRKHNIPDERFKYIHENADKIKSMAKNFYNERNRLDRELASSLENWMNQKYGNKDIPFPLKDFIEGTLKEPAAREKTSAVNDAVKTDTLIRTFKGQLKKKSEKDLFDVLYMGTYPKGNQKRLNALLKLPKEVQAFPDIASAIKYLQGAKIKTSLLREGLRSKEIDPANLKTFFNEYDNLLKKGSKGLDAKAEEKLLKETETKEPLKSIMDEKGNMVENEFININNIGDKNEIKYLDEVLPFENLYAGKVKDPELRRLRKSLDDHMDHYHNLDVVNLNGFFRGIFHKDINRANKQDLIRLDKIFTDMRTGSTWSQIADWITGRGPKDPIPIKKSNYWKFPEAIERDLRRSPAMMDWITDIGPYKSKLGNTIENARIVRPTAIMGELQQTSAKATELSMQEYEKMSAEWQEDLRPYVAALPEGDQLFRVAVAKREYDYGREVIVPNNPGKEGKEMAQPYFRHWTEARGEYNRLKDMNFNVPTENGTIKMTGEQVVEKINRTITRYNMKTHRLLTGDGDKVQKFLDMSEVGGKVTYSGLDKLRKSFYNYLTRTMRENIRLPIEEIGLDGLRKIIKRIQLSNMPVEMRQGKEGRKLLEKLRRSIEIETMDTTNNLGYEYYFPHTSFDRKSATANLLRALRKVSADKELSQGEIDLKAKKIIAQHKQMTGDFILKDDMDQNWKVVKDALENIAEGRKKRAETILSDGLVKVGNQFKREAHIDGWEMTPEAYEGYMKNIINQFYKSIAQVSSRTVMHNFRQSSLKKGNSAQFTNDWNTFFEMYTQAAMGYPVQIPQKVMDNPRLKVKGTPYKWLADSNAKKRIDNIRKKLGLGREELEKLNLNEKVVDELSGIEYTQLQNWGALEAKYQLATLLAHPKSAIANYYGGTVHTWVSAGWENLKKARNFEYLRTNINPKWKSMKDVEKWLQELGVLEEFLIYEAGLNPQLKSRKAQDFVKNVAKKLKKDPNLSDKSLTQMAKEAGLTKKVFDAASSFMRVPERALRRDAFMAHYLQARAKFGGAIGDYQSPFLIKMAKRGVKGTQFLYSAPYRPMWANSTLGRVFSRFQIWGWNSVRFRNDVLKQASLAGYKPGTQEFETFKRLALADLMMLSLSNLFMYSLFENSLPAPWNWFQDTTDMLFGSEKERERAFFGSPLGPVQAVTPPIARLLPPMFKGMVSGDWERMTDYYLWTMMPFGRLIRDVAGPGGIIENPFYSVTKMTGVPLMQMGTLVTKDDEEKGKKTRGRFIHDADT